MREKAFAVPRLFGPGVLLRVGLCGECRDEDAKASECARRATQKPLSIFSPTSASECAKPLA